MATPNKLGAGFLETAKASQLFEVPFKQQDFPGGDRGTLATGIGQVLSFVLRTSPRDVIERIRFEYLILNSQGPRLGPLGPRAMTFIAQTARRMDATWAEAELELLAAWKLSKERQTTGGDPIIVIERATVRAQVANAPIARLLVDLVPKQA